MWRQAGLPDPRHDRPNPSTGLVATRAAEDESLWLAFARGRGRDLDLRVVRGYLDAARRMFGLEATFCDLDVTERDSGVETTIWYYFDVLSGGAAPLLQSVPFAGGGHPGAAPRGPATE